jgi:hypothetical protein
MAELVTGVEGEIPGSGGPGGTVARAERDAAPASQLEASRRLALAKRVAVGGLLVGVMGDTLLRQGPFGVNLTLWMLVLAAELVLVQRRRHESLTAEERWLLAPVVVFALGFVWRDSPLLAVLNFLSVAMAFAMLAAAMKRRAGWSVAGAAARDYVQAFAHAVVSAMAGTLVLLASDIGPAGVVRGTGEGRGAERRRRRLGAVIRGGVISLPLLLVFTALLKSADPVFEHVITDVLGFQWDTLVQHVFFTGLFGWFAAGYLRGALVARESVAFPDLTPQVRVGRIELAMSLGTLNGLFLLFVAIQLRYLFGGASLVAATSGLTFAEYARKGFFELVWVSALVLPLLMGSRAVVAPTDTRSLRLHRDLSRLMIVLVAVIMASAVVRMQLYQREYGLTETRFYASAFMLWLGLVFAWLWATVLSGRPRRFALGALVSGWGVVAGLNAVNPDALIVRTNVARLEAGASFDSRYASSLSGDALPAIVAALPVVRKADPCLGDVRSWVGVAATQAPDWRTWNLGRARARRLAALYPELSRPACPPPAPDPRQAGGDPKH